MRFERARPRNDDEERILPLINIIFLLLIFFMLAGRLTATDPIPIDPPLSASDGPVDTWDVVILVDADGRLALGAKVMEESALRAAVADRLANDPAAKIRLKADGRAEANRIVGVMELLREAGAERLTLLTVPEGR